MASTKLTAREAIYKVLHKAAKPMSVPEIIKLGVPMTALSGKTPGQTFYSVLYAEAKKPKGLFQRTGKGSFKIRQGMTLENTGRAAAKKPAAAAAGSSQAKTDFKAPAAKRSTAKRSTAKRSTAKRSTAKRSTTTASSTRRRSSRSGAAKR